MSKNYFVNLKKDIQQINLTKSSIKNFARLHPFVSAKVVHEGLAMLSFIGLPAVYCINDECEKSRISHLSDQTRIYLFFNYIDFFNFIFKFDENCFNKRNFFSSCYFKEENFRARCTRFIPFPILTSLTKIYSVLRSKSVKNCRELAKQEITELPVEEIKKLIVEKTIAEKATERNFAKN